jgi:hypothetical protein
MQISKFVQAHAAQIFAYCNEVDRNELLRLMESGYSRSTFGISYPFCAEVSKIVRNDKYLARKYPIGDKTVRICNDWCERNRAPFVQYLRSKNITPLLPLPTLPRIPTPDEPRRRPNARFRGYPIGNAQNGFIRTLLSNIGQHSFSEADWQATKSDFDNKCAYCGEEKPLKMDHAVPINRANMGEHRIGNMVPSCDTCNNEKGGETDFREYLLGKDEEKMKKIVCHMKSRNYVCLSQTEQAKQVSVILELAHKEVAALAIRYITILNGLFPDSAIQDDAGDRIGATHLHD